MKAPKVTLSAAERQLMSDQNVILTKNSILNKVSQLFGQLGNEFQLLLKTEVPGHAEFFNLQPKVSKGEKHEGFPWVILDYPRHFSAETGHCAIRCFFWWGHFCSIQLQVSGDFLDPVMKALSNWQPDMVKNWLIGTTVDPWNMYLPNPEWSPINFEKDSDPASSMMYLKIAKVISLDEINILEKKMPEYFRQLLNLLQESFSLPDGERAP